MKITRIFFNRNTIQVAKEILGCYLINKTREGTTIGKIVETEAYLANDPASHSFNGKTKRNEKMFAPPGKAYIYFTYGMHHCFNVVTRPKGIGEAVLIRALEPISGIELMKKRRKTGDIHNFCNGPAKLVQALGIKKEMNGIDLTKGVLKIISGEDISEKDIVKTKRIGISKASNLKLRFYIKDNKFVSRR